MPGLIARVGGGAGGVALVEHRRIGLICQHRASAAWSSPPPAEVVGDPATSGAGRRPRW
ncbi:MAG: hypothetical protein M3256_09855 [Actinomycetota bacterium]|nr:hypothetical protein [Actinomycetota bacterium]